MSKEADFIINFKTFCENDVNCVVNVIETHTGNSSNGMDVLLKYREQVYGCEVKMLADYRNNSNHIHEIFGKIISGRKIYEGSDYRYGILIPQSALVTFSDAITSKFLQEDIIRYKENFQVDFLFVFDETEQSINIYQFPCFNRCVEKLRRE